MILHEDKKSFQELISLTSQELGIEEIIATLEELKSLCREFDRWKAENNVIFENTVEE